LVNGRTATFHPGGHIVKHVKTWLVVAAMLVLGLGICIAEDNAGEPKPLAHWALDAVTNGTIADSSGNGHTGTLEGLTAADLVDGPNGLKALNLAGNSHRDTGMQVTGPYVLIAGTAKDSAFNFNGKQFTVALWANYSETGGYIICQGRGAHWGWGIQAGNPAMLDLGGGSPQFYNFQGKTTGKWVHLAAVVDMKALTCAMYVDGQPAGTGTINPRCSPGVGNNTDDFVFGARTVGTSGISPYYKGMVADVYLFDQALTVEQIQALMKPHH
jgi:hypothetical protein